jgi:hypothetical protein
MLRTRMSVVEKGISDIASGLAALSTKFDKKSEIPWQALGVMLAFVGLIGGALYWPIRETQSELKVAMVEMTKVFGGLGAQFVSIRELDARTARGQADFTRINSDIRSIEAAQVPRAEHAERWRSIDRDFANFQGQITQLRNDFGSTYSLKDALARMERELEYLKRGRPPQT